MKNFREVFYSNSRKFETLFNLGALIRDQIQGITKKKILEFRGRRDK